MENKTNIRITQDEALNHLRRITGFDRKMSEVLTFEKADHFIKVYIKEKQFLIIMEHEYVPVILDAILYVLHNTIYTYAFNVDIDMLSKEG